MTRGRTCCNNLFIGYKPTGSAQVYTPAPQYLSHNT